MDILKLKFVTILSICFLTLSFGQQWVSYVSENQINDLVENSTELFLATDAGLVVVNKTTLEKTIYNKSNSNLNFNHIQAITQAPNGDIWIGTYDVSVARFDGSSFTDIQYPSVAGIEQFTKLYDIEIAPNGDVWLATSDGVLQQQGAVWTFYGENEIGPGFFEAWDLEINAAGDVFLGSIQVFKFSSGGWTNLFAGTTLLCYLDAELFFASNGDLHVAGDLERLMRYDGSSWIADSLGFTINNMGTGVFAEDLAGNIYYDTELSGIYKLENSLVWTLQSNTQTTAFGSPTSYYFIDSDGAHWLNQNIHFSKYKNGVIENTLISNTTLENVRTLNVHRGMNDKLYFITLISSYNISVLSTDGNWSSLSVPEQTVSGLSGDILVIEDNDIWMSSSAGLHHYDGIAWTEYNIEPCGNILMDSQGKIYILSSNRIYMIANNVFSEYNPGNSGLTNQGLIGHGIDKDDNLWIAAGGWANDNLIQKRESDGTWISYTEMDHPVLERPIGDFMFDTEGNVWIANANAGVIKFDGTTFTNPIKDSINSVVDYKVFEMAKDDLGKLYFSHQLGLTTIENGQLENMLIPDVPQESISTRSAITFDSVGNLWWGSNLYGVYAYQKEITSGMFSNEENLFDFNIFPNPTKDFTILRFDLETSSDVNVRMFNGIGQVVGHESIGHLPQGNHEHTINVSDLPHGIYFLHLQIDDKFAVKSVLVN